MTLTITIPDDVAERARALASTRGIDLNDFATAAISDAAALRPRRSLMAFSGVGAGQPGAIGDDVQGYISAMRDEWEEREQEIERQREVGIDL